MNPVVWHKVAAISGVVAVGLGSYGAHGFKPQNPSYKNVSFYTLPFFYFIIINLSLFLISFLLSYIKVWQTASLYHLLHTAALLAAPITKHPNIFGGLLTTGIVAFSGTCYTVAYLENRKYSTLAPFGGFAFIAAWGSLLF
ncbi:unnamed protein product [Lupinus luteus]|uniref:Transmembrane protein 256 homolog n=1 Tax=Lupinus luteus TaxID=3873 RepID=A0AAV1WF61_LUPLU